MVALWWMLVSEREREERMEVGGVRKKKKSEMCSQFEP